MVIHFDDNSTNAIRAWFRRNGIDCGCAFNHYIWEKGFTYDPETHRVNLPQNHIGSILDEELIIYLTNNGLTSKMHWLTATILHEVGHAETMRFFTENELKAYALRKQKISEQLTLENLIQSNYTYWSLPVEDMANKWAINYANAFPQKVERLEKILINHCIISE